MYVPCVNIITENDEQKIISSPFFDAEIPDFLGQSINQLIAETCVLITKILPKCFWFMIMAFGTVHRTWGFACWMLEKSEPKNSLPNGGE